MKMKAVLRDKVVRMLFASGVAVIAAASLPCSSGQERNNASPPSRGQRSISSNAVQKKMVPAQPKGVPAKLDRIAGQLTVAPPVTHGNLSIYLLEGDDLADTKNVLTLAEALGQKGKVVVRETSDVNELKVRSKASGETVFIMAGDIVKGGKQDRTLGTDFPLETKAGEVPVSAFCVEQGRWRARGGEDVATFSGSANAVATKEGKVAIRKGKDQGEVWKSVRNAQEKISGNVGKGVANAASPTSLQLSLEDKDLKKQNAARLAALQPIAGKNPRAIGFVTVINGHINSAEIFAGQDLFRRAWPKFAEAAATEAMAEQKGKPAAEPATAKQVLEFIAKADEAAATKERIHGDFWNVSAESDTLLLFQTIDESKAGRWLRRSIINK